MVNTHVACGHYELWKVGNFVHKSFPTCTRPKFHALKYGDLSLLLQLLLLLPVIVKIQKLMTDISFCIKTRLSQAKGAMVLYLKDNQPPKFYTFSEFDPFSQALTTLRHYSSWHIIRELPCESVTKSIDFSFVPSFMRLGQLESKLLPRTCIETARGLWRTRLEHAKKILGDIHAGNLLSSSATSSLPRDVLLNRVMHNHTCSLPYDAFSDIVTCVI